MERRVGNRKVQAQRKFAQGAYNPTYSNKVHTSTQKDNESNKDFVKTFKSSSTAKSLLDLVSFKSFHTHMQPVVLLERLQNTEALSPIVNKTKITQKNNSKIVHKMCLRSHTESCGNKISPQLYANKKSIRKKKIKNSKPNSGSEDERPLLYLKNSTTPQKTPVAEQTNQQETAIVEEDQVNTTTDISMDEKDTSICEENNDVGMNEQDYFTQQQEVIYPSTEQAELCQTKQESEGDMLVDNDNSMCIDYHENLHDQKDKNIHENISYNEQNESTPSGSNLMCQAQDGEQRCSNPLPIINDISYGTDAMAIIHSANSVTNQTVEHNFCPSTRFSTIGQVVQANENEFIGQCSDCSHCICADKVRLISHLYKKWTNLDQSILENGHPSQDPSNDGLIINSVNTTTPTTSRSLEQNESYGGVETYYLDFAVPMQSVLELKVKKLPNDKMQIVSANLVPKTSDIKVTNLNLIGNQKMLGDFLKLITKAKAVYNQTDNCSGNIKKIETIEISGDESEPDTPLGQQASKSTPAESTIEQFLQAPIYRPTEQEFLDPITFFNKIMPAAAKFGICKIIPPSKFYAECYFDEGVRFGVTNQYISRLYKRWGPASRELCAIKAHLASQSVIFKRPPLLDGIEVDLPKLYFLVQSYGGLKEVIEKKRWNKIAEEMRLSKTLKVEHKLDKIYVKYILPYDTLSDEERQELMKKVEILWAKKYEKMLQRARNPLHRQNRLLGDSDSSDEEIEEDIHLAGALTDSEDCITNGRPMTLVTYRKVASRAMETHVPNAKSTPAELEKIYWDIVRQAKDHVCVNTASIDTGEVGYGFTKNQRNFYGNHPWNLKVLSQNSGNVLHSLGPVLGVTVPTLHLGMVFSTSCWHRDPHGLPWIEYMHSGPGKIWYGIPDSQSDNFRDAVVKLCPTSCQSKSIWLPSDILMIPPDLLLKNNVPISRMVQEPGEFVIVFPKAYSSSISLGYTESESVYFATTSWLETIFQVFQEARASCEPTMFSLEQLLLSVTRDPNISPRLRFTVRQQLERIIKREVAFRERLSDFNLKVLLQNKTRRFRKHSRKRPAGAWNVRDQEECDVCQATLYLSRVWGLTGKKSSVCLEHAVQLLEKEPERVGGDLSDVGLEIFFTDTELAKIINKKPND
ncbi:protein Jumonji-like isoform X2 [Battus philenor]|uniref:protein Jumonji-like isoform X2 n=1 Tax=Battus philenor TaxID=42288 RepID=UPI0035CF8DA3